jgi:putative membrane protein
MIDRFQDHASNERTFLSWIRTAVAVAGFGLLIEKLPAGPSGGSTGLALIALSAALVLISTARFLVIRHEIRNDGPDSRVFGATELLFASMLALLLAALFVYLLGLATN